MEKYGKICSFSGQLWLDWENNEGVPMAMDFVEKPVSPGKVPDR